MNRKQKARKLARRQQHSEESRGANVATLDGSFFKDEIETGNSFVEVVPPKAPKPRRDILRRRIRPAAVLAPSMAQAAETAMANDGFVKVDALRTTQIEIEAMLEPAIAKARKQKKTAVLLREMANAGYKPKEGVEPKPSTTTTNDWEVA